jgi:hypothetical protein
MKLKIVDAFGNGIPLKNPEEIVISYPYMRNQILEKSLSRGWVKILSDKDGEIEVNLSEFEIDGLNEGVNQSFSGKIIKGDTTLTVFFERGLNVILNEEGKKQIK